MPKKPVLIRVILMMLCMLLVSPLVPIPPAQAEGIVIADAALDKAVREALGITASTPITKQALAELTTLTADNRGIVSLKGLEGATGLTTLSLNGNKIRDIAPLKGLTALTFLSVESNIVTSLSSLANTRNLMELNVAGNPITTISDLKGLLKLETLILKDTRVTGLMALYELPSILKVNVSGLAIDFNSGDMQKLVSSLTHGGTVFEGIGEAKKPQEKTAVQEAIFSEEVVFPIAFQRATKDHIVHVAANSKGIIMTTSDQYLNITRDNGKTWEARKLPYKTLAFIKECNDLFTLEQSGKNYVSKDGKIWTTLIFMDPEDNELDMLGVEQVNGTMILQAANRRRGKTYLFISKDKEGKAWDYLSVLDTFGMELFWNGKRYTAIAGGYKFAGKPTAINQFPASTGDSGELIVFSSTDLKNWTQHSGTVKKSLSYTFSVNGVPIKNYPYNTELSPADQITLFDSYGHLMVSTDGMTFELKEVNKALNINDWRSPILVKNNHYYVFYWYWISPGVVGTKMLTSKDKVNWQTKLISNRHNYEVFQRGNTFIARYSVSYQSDALAISNDGINWKQIK